MKQVFHMRLQSKSEQKSLQILMGQSGNRLGLMKLMMLLKIEYEVFELSQRIGIVCMFLNSSFREKAAE
jgi:hypothetical protein